MELHWTSDRTLRVHAPGAPAHAGAALFAALHGAGIDGVADLTPWPTGVLVTVTGGVAMDGAAAGRVEGRVRALCVAALASGLVASAAGRTVEIPVRYGGDAGPDLADVARECGLTPDRVVAAHTVAAWRVLFVGFTPGFAYLGVDEGAPAGPARLDVARLERPRARVEAGSVGLAGTMSGVYPSATPGGWRIIGRTGVVMFDPSREPAALLLIGDRVRFVAV